MLRLPISRNRALLAMLVAIAVQACDSEAIAVPASSPDPGFVVMLGTSTLFVTAGDTARTTITAARIGGLATAINFTVTSFAQPGLAADISSTSVADSSTLIVAAAGALAPGTYPIVVSVTAGALTRHLPVVVVVTAAPIDGPAIDLVFAGAHTCALATSGAAYCWGYNANGQLGNNDTSSVNPRPVAVLGGLQFQSLSVSKVDDVTCGISFSGAAYCWGQNDRGQLGDGTMTRRLTPTLVVGGLTFARLAVGNGHVCGVATTGSTYCWGSTPNGAFGDGTVGTHLAPTPTAPGMTFDSIVAGSDFTCALTTEGAAYCWGLGANGQLGTGANTSSTTPVPVAGGLTFRILVAGGQTVCGLTIEGKTYCWGQNFYGTVGDGTSGTDAGPMRRPTPVAVAGGLTFEALSAGYATMCGVTADGAGYCWGYNFGAVGDGTSDHRSSPTAVSGGLTFKHISSGTGYSCGVTIANAVYCWGDNSNGQLGDGTTMPGVSPAPVRWP